MKDKKVIVNNFTEVENYMKFEKGTFYKFAIIVRNKDGRTPLIVKNAPSGETTIKQWYVNTADYYFSRAKQEMTALADATRGRLYMCIERKSTYKMFLLLLDKIVEIIKEALTDTNSTPKRLNKIINRITSESKCSDKNYKTWMYDIDNEDVQGIYKNAIYNYLTSECDLKFEKILTLRSRTGWHIIVPRKFAIKDNWKERVSEFAVTLAKERNAKLTSDEITAIIQIAEEIEVHSNQMCLVYYSEEEC